MSCTPRQGGGQLRSDALQPGRVDVAQDAQLGPQRTQLLQRRLALADALVETTVVERTTDPGVDHDDRRARGGERQMLDPVLEAIDVERVAGAREPARIGIEDPGAHPDVFVLRLADRLRARARIERDPRQAGHRQRGDDAERSARREAGLPGEVAADEEIEAPDLDPAAPQGAQDTQGVVPPAALHARRLLEDLGRDLAMTGAIEGGEADPPVLTETSEGVGAAVDRTGQDEAAVVVLMGSEEVDPSGREERAPGGARAVRDGLQAPQELRVGGSAAGKHVRAGALRGVFLGARVRWGALSFLHRSNPDAHEAERPMILRTLAPLPALLLSLSPAAAQDGAAAAPAVDDRWRNEVIGYEEEIPIRLGEMVDALSGWYLKDVAKSFEGEYGKVFRQSPQVAHWIASYLDLRGMLPDFSEEALDAAVQQTLNDAGEIIAQRIEARIRRAQRTPGRTPFPPGVTRESMAEHELRLFLTSQGMALLTKTLAERSIPAPTYADVRAHHRDHALRWAAPSAPR